LAAVVGFVTIQGIPFFVLFWLTRSAVLWSAAATPYIATVPSRVEPKKVEVAESDVPSELAEIINFARNYTLTRIATLLNLPIITTASVPDGPNGPVMPEIAKEAPQAVYVPRQGEVNAWDNDLFVKTVRDTGKKTLIMAGVWTNVCVMLPALDAKAAGFNVYAVVDASGDPSEMASRTTLARFTQAGIVPTNTNAVICELHRTWRRPEAAEIADIYTAATPAYRAVIESYQNAKNVGLAAKG
jgi:nicotinamidase-related amidase